MEFPFDVNRILPSEFLLLDNTFNTGRNLQKDQSDQICSVIDKMGVLSAKAQNLHGAITSASKMKFSDHHLYMMTDSETTSGKGAVVGFLKVGCKKLFVYDRDGNQHEMEPLCVLDFYVHESRQRHGCGKKLFEHMLQAEGIRPHKLAIDRPSHKFISFLQKHYGLKSTIRQVNNFVIFDGFFKENKDNEIKGKRNYRPPAYSGRTHDDRLNGFGMRPTSGKIQSIGLDKQKEALSKIKVQRPSSYERPPSGRQGSATGGYDRDPGRAMAAQHSLYSRHTLDEATERRDSSGIFRQAPPSPAQRHKQSPALPLVGINREEVSKAANKIKSPPLLNRDGPSKEFANLLNNHQSYLDRGGRMKVPQDNLSANSSPIHQPYATQQATGFNRQERMGIAASDVSWTPSKYVGTSPKINPKFQQTRLW